MNKKINIITLFPEVFPGSLGVGLIGKALKNGVFEINTIDLKKYSDKNYRVDDRPCGGGPGMIIKAEILSKCFDDNGFKRIFFLSPGGMKFDQKMAEFFRDEVEDINILCGRYEGIDARLFEEYEIIEISLGDFILCGGESAALCILESIIRIIPGVLNNIESSEQESFSDILIEHSHYTKPNIWRSMAVPQVLLEGSHRNILNWKIKNAIRNTKKYRYDLWISYKFSIFSFYFLKFSIKHINRVLIKNYLIKN